MIIEEKQKIEIVENPTKIEKEKFKQIPNNSEKSSKHWVMAICIFLISFLVFIIIIFGIFTIYTYSKDNTISQGIYINGIDVSNLTKKEALQKLNDYYSEKLLNDITLVHNDYTTYIKTS